MTLGAILVVTANPPEAAASRSDSMQQPSPQPETFAAEPLACAEILGRSSLQRTIRRLHEEGVKAISIVVPDFGSSWIQELPLERVQISLVRPPLDPWISVSRLIKEYADDGIQGAMIMRMGAYVEFDPGDLLAFHRAKGHSITGVRDEAGPLDYWLVNTNQHQEISARELEIHASTRSQLYPFATYVNRLQDAWDLRRLTVDALQSRCDVIPGGHEVRPGVWLDEGASVHRTARIVAPAYVGKGVKVRGATLITRGSSIERGGEVDYGTVVEDTSVFPNTYLGTCLDVCHSVVAGKELIHLRHNVSLKIDDSKLIDDAGSFERRRPFAIAAARMKGCRLSNLSSHLPERSWWSS